MNDHPDASTKPAIGKLPRSLTIALIVVIATEWARPTANYLYVSTRFGETRDPGVALVLLALLLLNLANVISRLVAAVLYLAWLYTGFTLLRDNLPADEKPAFTPGFAIKGWFIPGYDFIHGYLAMRALWRQSELYHGPVELGYDATGANLAIWWLADLVAAFVGFAEMMDASSGLSYSVLRLGFVGCVATIIAGIELVWLVRRIHARLTLLSQSRDQIERA